jgi:hypothetical protein
MTSILDRNFRYYAASDTDLRRTFRRVRRQLREQSPQRADGSAVLVPVRAAVVPMTRARSQGKSSASS